MYFTLEAVSELYGTICESKKRIVSAASYQITWVKLGATLTNNNGTGGYLLTSKTLNAKTFSF